MSTCELSPSPVERRASPAARTQRVEIDDRPPVRRSRFSAGKLFAAVLIGGLILRLIRLALNAPLWGDEAMLVHSLLDRGYTQLLKPLDYVQIAPLGFLWGELTCFRLFGSAEWVWRLLPTIAGCASLIGLAHFARQTLPKHAAWLTAAIAACSLYLVRHTVEVKPYIVDFAFAVALLQLGWRVHLHSERLTRWLAFGALAALGVWCSFPSAFVSGGVLLSLVRVLVERARAERTPDLSPLPRGGEGQGEGVSAPGRSRLQMHHDKRSENRSSPEMEAVGPLVPLSLTLSPETGARGLEKQCSAEVRRHQCPRGEGTIRKLTVVNVGFVWLLCGFALSASFLAMYFLFGRVQVKTASDAGYWQFSMWEVAFPPWRRPHQLVWWLVREHTGAMMAHPFGGKNFASLGTSLLVISGVATLRRNNPRLLSLLLMPAGLGFLAACLQKYPYGGTARTMLYLAPAICLLAGLGAWAMMIKFVAAAKRRTVFRGALWCCLALIGGKLVLEIACPYKQYGDWVVRQTVERWAAEAQPDDIWVIANAATTPDRTDTGIYGGVTVAVFDHYTQIHAKQRAIYPRRIIDYPETSGRVTLLVHESGDWPLTIDVGKQYAAKFAQQARLVSEERVPLRDRDALRKLVFVTK